MKLVPINWSKCELKISSYDLLPYGVIFRVKHDPVVNFPNVVMNFRYVVVSSCHEVQRSLRQRRALVFLLRFAHRHVYGFALKCAVKSYSIFSVRHKQNVYPNPITVRSTVSSIEVGKMYFIMPFPVYFIAFRLAAKLSNKTCKTGK